MIQVWFDGSITKNPGGKAYAGWVIKRDNRLLVEDSCFIGEGDAMSNNVAEYEALNKALEYLRANRLNSEEIEAYGDSEIVVRRMTERRRSNGLCKPYSIKCLKLLNGFKSISFTWIPRNSNEEADRMSKVRSSRVSEYDYDKDLTSEYLRVVA